MKTILIHGPSGSGKDTQVDLLEEHLEFERIGTGDMFRTMYKEGDEQAIEAHKYWKDGVFVPSKLTYDLLTEWLGRFDSDLNWVFISAVRKADQIPLFEAVLEDHHRELDLFLHFTLSEEDAIERRSLRRTCPKCGLTYHKKFKPPKEEGICDVDGTKLIQREDDTVEATKSLIREYEKDIDPILKEYKKRGVLEEIDASPSIPEIHREVLKVINSLNDEKKG